MTPIFVTMKDAVNGGVKDLPGWNVGVPGLAVYRPRTVDGDDCWCLAHVRSGCCLPGGFMSPEAAVSAAHALSHIDWTSPGDAFQDRGIKREIVAILAGQGFDVRAGRPGNHDLSDVSA